MDIGNFYDDDLLQTRLYKVYKVRNYYIGVSNEIREGILSSSGLIIGLDNGPSFSKLFFAGLLALFIMASSTMLSLLWVFFQG